MNNDQKRKYPWYTQIWMIILLSFLSLLTIGICLPALIISIAARFREKKITLFYYQLSEKEKLESHLFDLNSKIENRSQFFESEKENFIDMLRQEIDVEKEQIISDAKLSANTIIENAKKEEAKITANLDNTLLNLQNELDEKENEKSNLVKKIANLNDEIIQLDEEVLLQSFGFYETKYDLENSSAYKERLKDIRNDQKIAVKDKTAVSYYSGWTVNGSSAEGKKMNANTIKMAIRSFNNECDVTINKVTVSNYENSRKKINKSFEQINKLNEKNMVSIEGLYLELKQAELDLALEYAIKVKDEKEEQRQIREQMREEEKARKEIEKEIEKVTKEETHFNNALEKLKKQLLQSQSKDTTALEEKIKELELQLVETIRQKDLIHYREQNTRAGYVYIISNIGSFGENIYKIGMTRRLEPMDRVNELGDASVPFKFDVHAFIFSEDAPTLESILHKEFDHKKVNMVNSRKEFFNVSLDEIENVVSNNFDKTVEFKKTAVAEEYRETLTIRNKLSTAV